ncbi:ABC transporter permease [Arthrobacter sp. BL-252-APC-1A]|uniref:ABC transporter permease n=1 Tax=Arthrobacter sp. BL-252-APC-1A TaxID=2606622 RepID=UPI0012B3F8D3|nr:ABC transporter permease [Arthrobacter sp. BL-252-APC-1A]MSS00358.1 ABC transporter permease [Arthrobacter sp. BL-252-APC-1A]
MSAPALNRRNARRRRSGGAFSGPLARICLGWLALVALLAVLGPMITPFDATEGNIVDRYLPASAEHWLGTDQAGRDLFTRLAVGARSTILAALAVAGLTVLIGGTLALVAVWFGGRVDGAITRFLDFLFSFPNLLLAVLAVAVFGAGVETAVVAMAIGFSPYTARVIRSVARERNLAYVKSAELQGISGLVITFRHVLPNVKQQILTGASINFGYAMIDLAALSFLGFGVQPPDADWGLMVSSGQASLLAGYPQESIFAGTCIVLTVAALGYLGEQLGGRRAAGRA